MLDVSFEFVRGILFVRLEGKINHDNIFSVSCTLKDIISKGGLKFLVFNLSNAVLEERVSIFDECNNLINGNGGEIFICGYKNNVKQIISKKCNIINDEISALKVVNAC